MNTDYDGSSPEADTIMSWTALQRSQIKIFISNIKPLFFFFYLLFLSVYARKDTALYSGTIPKSNVKSTATQQKFLDSMTRVALNNRIDLYYLLAEQGSRCVISNNNCYTWIATSSEVDSATYDQASWLRKSLLQLVFL